MVFPFPRFILFLLVAFCTVAGISYGQFRLPRPEPKPEDAFIGHWNIQTEGGSELYLNVKERNLASFFYGGIDDNTIYLGSWEIFGDALFLEWKNGHTWVMRQIDARNFRIALFESGYTGEESPEDEGVAREVPENEVGTWTIPPDELEARSTAEEDVVGFFGNWEIQDPKGFTYYIRVNDDRTAASSYPRSRKDQVGLRGYWRRQGSELHINWDTGHYQIIRERPNDYVTELWEPADELSVPNATVPTFRVPEIPTPGWLEIYQSEEVFARANPFRTRKDANNFFRGDWVILDQGEPVQEIDVGRFGGTRIKKTKMKGDWRSASDALYIYWDDGHRAILKPHYLSFTYQIFAPGQPFDGTPSRIYPVVPDEPAKMDRFRRMMEDATLRLRVYQEIQEEIQNQPIPTDDDRRKPWWHADLWPFGGKDS